MQTRKKFSVSRPLFNLIKAENEYLFLKIRWIFFKNTTRGDNRIIYEKNLVFKVLISLILVELFLYYIIREIVPPVVEPTKY